MYNILKKLIRGWVLIVMGIVAVSGLSTMTIYAQIKDANLGVSLGDPNVAGSFIEERVNLNQSQIRQIVLQELRKLREEMWDLNPRYNQKTLQEVAKEEGLTTKTAYVNALNWDTTLEKKAIQRTVETNLIPNHIRTDLSGYDIGYENLAWGSPVNHVIRNGWGYDELNDLNTADGQFNYQNGHLHTQLNPSLRSFAVAFSNGITAGAYSWNDSQNSTGTNLEGTYMVSVKVANELTEVNGKLGYRGNQYYRPKVTGLITHTDGFSYYVKDGEVDNSFTGIIDALVQESVSNTGIYRLQSKKAYIHNGKLDTHKKGLVLGYDQVLYYVENGFVDTTFVGTIHYNNYWYDVKNGIAKLSSTKNQNTNNQKTIANMYRLYNKVTRRHFYTMHYSEVKLLQSRGWILEGVAWVNSTDANGTPVYRVWNKQTGERLFTRHQNEITKLVGRGWVNEGIAFRMPSNGQKIYRLMHKQTKQYVLSAKMDEIQKMIASGQWINEGVAFFAVPS